MKKSLNILHLSSLNLWPMGQNKGRLSIYLPLEAFAKRGHKVAFFTNQEGNSTGYLNGIYIKQIFNPIKPINKKKFTKLTRLITLPFSTISFIITAIKYSIKTKPDIIYAHTPETALPAFVIAKLFKSKYVLRLYGIGNKYKESIIKKLLNIDLYFAFLIKADLYILTNDGTSADRFALARGVPKEKIHFLKNGINKDWANKKVNEQLKSTFAPNGEKIILSVSRLTGWKQIDIIIKSIPELIKMNNNIKLLIVGDGIERNNLESLVAELNIERYVHFAGAQEQSKVIEYISIADIFVSMNALSSMSNPVFEAMINKKPVIALNTGNTEEIIKNNITGILVEPNEIKNLSKVINAILNDYEKRQFLGENAQKLVLQNFPSWEERLNIEIQLIENLAYNV